LATSHIEGRCPFAATFFSSEHDRQFLAEATNTNKRPV